VSFFETQCRDLITDCSTAMDTELLILDDFLELANDINVHRGVGNFDDELNYTKASFVHSSLFTCNTAVRYSQCMIFWFTVLLFN